MKPRAASEICENYEIHLSSQTFQNTKEKEEWALAQNENDTAGTTWEIRQD